MLLPSGSIDDLGAVHSTLRVYVFKFKATVKCFDTATANLGVPIINSEDKYIKIPVGIRRNVAWSFYSLISDSYFNVDDHHISGQLLRPGFVYIEPSAESEHMAPLLMTIRNIMEQIRKIQGLMLTELLIQVIEIFTVNILVVVGTYTYKDKEHPLSNFKYRTIR